MKRRFVFGALLGALVANFLVGAQVYFAAAEKNEPYPNLELFSRVLEFVRKDYVDGQDLTYQDLIYSALRGMLSNLDPHSEFMEPVAWWLWRTIYLAKLPRFEKKVRVMFDWTLDLLFSKDLVQYTTVRSPVHSHRDDSVAS